MCISLQLVRKHEESQSARRAPFRALGEGVSDERQELGTCSRSAGHTVVQQAVAQTDLSF